MYNIRASLQKYKIKKIHQKSPDRETVFNYHLNSGLTFNNHGFDTGKYDDPSVVGNKNCLYDPFVFLRKSFEISKTIAQI